MAQSIACIGGGPGGLFAATLIKRDFPHARVTVFERNHADDTYGFGVVFSDATLAKIDAADPVLTHALKEHGVHWDDIEVRLKGEAIRAGGNGMAAIARKKLLLLLQDRARAEGVELRFETEVTADDLASEFDVVVAADGANSRTRAAHEDDLGPSFEEASARFIWFGTTYRFDGLTFVHRESPHGVFAVHGYPISDDVSTFIVETDAETWRRAGLDEFDTSQAPGPSDERSRAFLEELFAPDIEGHPLLVNNSRWGQFRTRAARTWHTGNVAILGDAAHTAHFSVGSGTKMAMEDAIELARALREHDDVEAALVAYEAYARPSVEKIQGSARPSLSWWEHFGRYFRAFAPTQFAFHFMSRAISRSRIARRDPRFVALADAAWRDEHHAEPLATPLALGGSVLSCRTGRLSIGTATAGPANAQVEVGEVVIPTVAVGGTPPAGPPWALHVLAPQDESGLAGTAAQLAAGAGADPDLVVVSGGTPLTRVLVAEEARLGRGLPVAIAEDADADRATTLVLSGRADLVLTDLPIGEEPTDA